MRWVYNFKRRRPEEWQRWFDLQQGRCELCLSKLFSDYPRQTVMDHDHVTGECRALLCAGCNILVGNYELGRSVNYAWVDDIELYLAIYR